MRTYHKQSFEDLDTFDSPSGLSDAEFHDCHFGHCTVANVKRPADRFTIKDVKLTRCTHRDCVIATAVLENVVIDTLKKQGRLPFITWGTVFKHVTIRGRVQGSILLNRSIDTSMCDEEQAIWDADAKSFYAECDWALDISGAEFTGIDIRCVPGHLIRRDPRTQILVTREKAAASDYMEWRLGAYQLAITQFLREGLHDSFVLIAEKKSPTFKRELAILDMIRDRGLAEEG